MKICVLATSYPRHSGDHASVFVHTFCKGLVERGLEIKAIVPHEKGLSTEDSFDGVTLRRFRYLWPSHLEQVAYGYGIPENLRYKFWAKIGLPFFVLGFLIKAWRETLNCDLIHAHWEISALVGILISRKRKIPLVLTVHRLVAQNKLMKWLTKFIFTRMDMLHFNSTFTRNQARALLDKIPDNQIIYPSIDIKFFRPGSAELSYRKKFGIDQDNPVLLGLGRLVEKKGFRYLIEAFSSLCKRFSGPPTPYLIIAGGGPLLTSLKDLAYEICPPQRVYFTGFVLPSEVLSLLREATLMAVPSIMDSKGEIETLGVVSMEAMACGVPVIASRVGGIPDVIEDGTSGILVNPRDPEDLAQALDGLLKDSLKRKKFAEGGVQRIKQLFSLEVAIKETLKSYKKVLALAGN